MKPVTCGWLFDKYIIACRYGNNKGSVISRGVFDTLRKLSSENAELPEKLTIFLGKLGISASPPQRLNEIVHILPRNKFAFGSASYEITERCNYRCSHCVLGNKKETRELSVSKKMQIIQAIRDAGCVFLKITGGEPLVASGFREVYSYADLLGMIIKVQTNGSLLSERKNQKMFEKRRPHKIVMSIYGGGESSYQKLTRTPGSFNRFLKSVDWLKKSGILVRANIIVTKHNEHEIDKMVEMAIGAGFEYFIYPKLTPTFKGNPAPMELAINNCSAMKEIDKYNQRSIPQEKNKKGGECLAGKAFFHVNKDGGASVCQAVRRSSVSLLREGITGLSRLTDIAREVMKKPSKCELCEYNKECSTCPPTLGLFQRAGRIPSHVCMKYGS